MASNTLNIAVLKNASTVQSLYVALETWGRPKDKEHGILELQQGEDWVSAQLFVSREATLKQVDKETGAVHEKKVTRDELIPFKIWPAGVVEIYKGTWKKFETLQMFLREAWEEKLEIEPFAPNLRACFTDIQERLGKADLIGARLPYSADDTTSGKYSAKFTDTASGIEFLDKTKTEPEALKVTYELPKAKGQKKPKKVKLTLMPNACFRYHVGNSLKEPAVRNLLRKVVGADVSEKETIQAGTEVEE